jgi:6-phosphogluconolactonase
MYSVDLATARLAHRRTTPIDSSLAYLAIDPSGRYLPGASYGEHRVSLYRAGHIASGAGEPRQVVAGIEHAHAVTVSPGERFAYVSSLGLNVVLCYALEAGVAGAQLTAVDEVALGEGFGPRHLRVSPDGNTLYVLSEFRGTVAAVPRDAQTGCLGVPRHSDRPAALAHLDDGRARSNVSGVVQPDPTTLASLIWAADIHVTPDGRFVYVSERTSSRLIAYRVAPDGALQYASFIDTETQPRGFKIDPSGRLLVACGEKSSHVAVYAIDAMSGALSPVSRCEGGRGANWVEIIAHALPPAPHTASRNDARQSAS